jgi:hypothetical protein
MVTVVGRYCVCMVGVECKYYTSLLLLLKFHEVGEIGKGFSLITLPQPFKQSIIQLCLCLINSKNHFHAIKT